MLSIDFAPVSVSDADSATADMKRGLFMEAPHVLDNCCALGTNAEAFDATESKSADRREIFLKSSIFKYFYYTFLYQKRKYCDGRGEDIPFPCGARSRRRLIKVETFSKKGFHLWAMMDDDCKREGICFFLAVCHEFLTRTPKGIFSNKPKCT